MSRAPSVKVGDVGSNNKGLQYEVVKYVTRFEVYVRFAKTNNIQKTTTMSIKEGYVRDCMSPSVAGVGFLGRSVSNKLSRLERTLYSLWRGMIYRCYDERSLSRAKNESYNYCKVHKDWHNFSNFYKWASLHYKEGLELDKDLLIKGNKVYSEDTCVFLTPRLNKIMLNNSKGRGTTPLGSSFEADTQSYRVRYSAEGKDKHVGRFDCPIEAFNAYKEVKEKHIQAMATEDYNLGLISEVVYKALLKFKINEND